MSTYNTVSASLVAKINPDGSVAASNAPINCIRESEGLYVVTFPTGMFDSAPIVEVTTDAESLGNQYVISPTVSDVSNAKMNIATQNNLSGPFQDAGINLVCFAV